jgi:HPt (histidine-containing phosphotransfer) domain-containing protein
MNTQPPSTAEVWSLPEIFEGMEPDEASSMLRELLEAYRTDTAARLDKLRSAAAAGDLATVRAEAHSVKGSSRQVGAEALAAACQEIELGVRSMSSEWLAERTGRLHEHFSSAVRAMTSYASGH